MKADQIHISQFDFLTLERLEIDRELGKHATATVAGYISDENLKDYKWKVLEHIWVTVTAKDESGESRILMTGMIAGFAFEPRPHAAFMTLVLKSGTYLMDSAVHFRSYQNSAMTYMEVLDSITGTYGKAGIKGEVCLETTPCDFLLQHKETDWAFIKRLASYFGLSVTPAVTNEGSYYYVGSAHYNTYELPESAEFSVAKKVDLFMEQGANGQGSSFEQDYLEYRITAREVYDLWDELRVGTSGGYVFCIHSEYRQGELLHCYTLRPMSGMGAMQVSNHSLPGRSFLAEIKEVQRDSVRIVFTGRAGMVLHAGNRGSGTSADPWGFRKGWVCD